VSQPLKQIGEANSPSTQKDYCQDPKNIMTFNKSQGSISETTYNEMVMLDINSLTKTLLSSNRGSIPMKGYQKSI